MVWGLFARCLTLVLFVSHTASEQTVKPTEITDEIPEMFIDDRVHFTEELYDMKRSIGRTVTLSCSIMGTPPLNLFMYHDKIATHKKRNRRRLTDTDTIYDPATPKQLKIIHVIHEVKSHQDGVYKCQGESIDGSVAFSTADLTLEDPCEGVTCGFREKCINVKGDDICTCDFDCPEEAAVCAGGLSYGSMCHLKRTECRMGNYLNQDIEEGACANEKEQTEAGCTLSGEGHVTKFNGDHFTFKGSCPYLMAKDVRRGVFVAYARTEQCGTDLSGVCLRSVTIYVDRIYGFSLERGWLINDNGKSRNVANGETVILGMGAVTITRTGKTLVGEVANKGIMFYYDGLNYFKISVPLDYVSSEKDFTGFCGPVPVDSLPHSGRDISQLGEIEMPALGSDPAVCAPVYGMPPCTDPELAAQVRDSFLNNEALAACSSAVPALLYVERAVADTCSCSVNQDNNYCFCNVLYSYAEDCRQAGVKLVDFGGESCAKSFHKDVFKAERITYNQYRRWKKNK